MGDQIYAFQYAYDATGNRTRRRREFDEGVEWDSTYYAYDASNALIRKQVMPANVTTYYYYDANGSRARQVEGGATTYFEYGPQRLITKIIPPLADGNPWQFDYDANSNRYKMDKGGTVSFFQWDGPKLLEERAEDETLLVRYTHGYSPIPNVGTALECYLPSIGESYFLAMDHHGTVNVILDQDGAEVGRRYYDDFGIILGQTGSWPIDLGYQTPWLMVKVGNKWWCLSKYRLYDPDTGTYTSRDPLPLLKKIAQNASGNALGSYTRLLDLRAYAVEDPKKWAGNLYEYARSNPTNLTDAEGLEYYEDCFNQCVGSAMASSQGADQAGIYKDCARKCQGLPLRPPPMPTNIKEYDKCVFYWKQRWDTENPGKPMPSDWILKHCGKVSDITKTPGSPEGPQTPSGSSSPSQPSAAAARDCWSAKVDETEVNYDPATGIYSGLAWIVAENSQTKEQKKYNKVSLGALIGNSDAARKREADSQAGSEARKIADSLNKK